MDVLRRSLSETFTESKRNSGVGIEAECFTYENEWINVNYYGKISF